MCEITSSTVGGNQWVFHTLAGEENGSPLQYSCLENPVDGGGWRATVHGVAESNMTEATQHSPTLYTLAQYSSNTWQILDKYQQMDG